MFMFVFIQRPLAVVRETELLGQQFLHHTRSVPPLPSPFQALCERASIRSQGKFMGVFCKHSL